MDFRFLIPVPEEGNCLAQTKFVAVRDRPFGEQAFHTPLAVGDDAADLWRPQRVDGRAGCER